MMPKRKPFFIKNNFQLKFVVFFVILLAFGIFSAALVIYGLLKEAFEKAVFSSHLSLGSSGELFWQAIVHVNLFVVFISVGIGLMLCMAAHCYLDSLFGSLVDGLKRLGRGDFSVRLRTAQRRWGAGLLKDFNKTAKNIQDNDAEILNILNDLIEKFQRPQHPSALGIKRLQERLRQARFF